MKKRVLAAFLAFCMTFSSSGIPAMAAEPVSDVVMTEEPEEAAENAEEEGSVDLSGEQTEEQEEPADVEEPVEEQEVPLEEEPVMLTFVDEVQMEISYNAAETAAYQYTVTDGVLTALTTGTGEAVSGNVVLANDKGITEIGSNVFQGNKNITYVKLPVGVEKIADNAFTECTKLKGITIPKGTKEIGKAAFAGCTALTQLAIPKTLVTIGEEAFCGDKKLFMVYLKDASYNALETIGASAFKDCEVLSKFCSDTSFVFPDGLKTIGASAFENCDALTNITMPAALETLGERAFAGCTALTEVAFSPKLKEISASAFENCISLVTLEFTAGNETIGENAFKGCYALNRVELLFKMQKVGAGAFAKCTGLKSVTIQNGNLVIGSEAFPNLKGLYLIGFEGSTAEDYAHQVESNISFLPLYGNEEENQSYSCAVKVSGTGSGTVKVYYLNEEEQVGAEVGVLEGEIVYVTIKANSDSMMVAGSLKCNGKAIAKTDGVYSFKMPKGGAVITVEFERKQTQNSINGLTDDVDVELSNGNELKIGQTTRLFLVDSMAKGGGAVDPSKISFKSDKTAVATVSPTGMIKALKPGIAKITASVKGGDGRTIIKEVVITVSSTDVAQIKLKASGYDKNVEITEEEGTPLAIVERTTATKARSFRIDAAMYDADDEKVNIKLNWKSSDPKVAKLSKSTTEEGVSYNTVTIPVGVSGEATITVSATNADKSVTTQKFIVSVRDYTPRLVQNKITLNPNMIRDAKLELVSAYGKTFEAEDVKLYYADKDNESTDFELALAERTDDGEYTSYYITAKYVDGLADGKYSVVVNVDNGHYKIPMTITVKRSVPNPGVSFDRKQQKVNLFYKNDGTEVVPVFKNLGTAKISSYRLEAFSNKEDDLKFTKNFKIDPVTGVITRTDNELEVTAKGKAVVAGYLVIQYENYKSSIEKKFKITIPTQTLKTAYVLNKTADTFNMQSAAQTVTLQVLDKKTKQPVVLDPDKYRVVISENSTTDSVKDWKINESGSIELSLSKNPSPGKVIIQLTNSDWAASQAYSFTYTLKTTAKNPSISFVKSTVTLSKNYPEQVAEFALRSNQLDTQIADEQEFAACANQRTQVQYEKLEVNYEDGVGTVKVLDPTIQNGTYKFTCAVKGDDGRAVWNKVTLSVKVTQSIPSVALKGGLTLNLLAENEGGSYAETAESLFVIKNQPEEYALNIEETLNTIECTTKNFAGAEEWFTWKIEDGKLKVSLNENIQARTYGFRMTPKFAQKDGDNIVAAKTLSFSVKVYKGTISVSLAAKGRLNLLDRTGAFTDKNSIVYTPKFKNLKDEVADVKIYDAASGMPRFQDPESTYFDAEVIGGKIYVRTKAGAALDNNKTYPVKVWVGLKQYRTDNDGQGFWINGVLKLKTAQIVPAAAADQNNLTFYLSNRAIERSFYIEKKAGTIGTIAGVAFDEADTKAAESFVLSSELQQDGSIKVTMRLKNGAAYTGDSSNKVKLYVSYQGQGTNTKGTLVTMNVAVRK